MVLTIACLRRSAVYPGPVQAIGSVSTMGSRHKLCLEFPRRASKATGFTQILPGHIQVVLPGIDTVPAA